MPHGPSRRPVPASQCTPARCLPVRPTAAARVTGADAGSVRALAACSPMGPRPDARRGAGRSDPCGPPPGPDPDRSYPLRRTCFVAYGDGRGPGGLGAGPHGGPLGTCSRPAVISSGSRAPACQGRYPARADRIAASANPAACGHLTGWGGGGEVSSAGCRGPTVPGGVLTATPISVSSSSSVSTTTNQNRISLYTAGMAHWRLLACWASLLGLAPRSRRQGTPGLGSYGLHGRYPDVARSNWAMPGRAVTSDALDTGLERRRRAARLMAGGRSGRGCRRRPSRCTP